MSDESLKNPEYAKAADNLLNVVRINLAKKGNKSPTAKEVLKLANEVLGMRV